MNIREVIDETLKYKYLYLRDEDDSLLLDTGDMREILSLAKVGNAINTLMEEMRRREQWLRAFARRNPVETDAVVGKADGIRGVIDELATLVK